MYEVDLKDRVVELEGVPQSSVGAPIPVVLAGEHDVMIPIIFKILQKTGMALLLGSLIPTPRVSQ